MGHLVRLSASEDYEAKEFWQYVHRSFPDDQVPEEVLEITLNGDVIVSPSRAGEVLQWCSALPHWSNGRERAIVCSVI